MNQLHFQVSILQFTNYLIIQWNINQRDNVQILSFHYFDCIYNYYLLLFKQYSLSILNSPRQLEHANNYCKSNSSFNIIIRIIEVNRLV